MKRIISLFITVIMLLGLCVPVFAGTEAFPFLTSAVYSEKLGIYAVGGRNGKVYVSKNGTDFMKVVTGNGLIGNNGQKHLKWLSLKEEFIAVDVDTTNKKTNRISVSSNGKDWTSYTSILLTDGSSVMLTSIEYINNEYVATGPNGNLYTSTDLTKWTKVTTNGYLTDSADYFRGITISDDGDYVVLYTTKKWDASKNTNAAIFAGSTADDDWYNSLSAVNTEYSDGKGAFINVYDVKYSTDRNRFYGIGGSGSSDAFFFEYEADVDTLYRRKGATASLTANTFALEEREKDFIFTGFDGKNVPFIYTVAKTQMESDYSSKIFDTVTISKTEASTEITAASRTFAIASGEGGTIVPLTQKSTGFVNVKSDGYTLYTNATTDNIFVEASSCYSVKTTKQAYTRSIYDSVTVPVMLYDDTNEAAVDNATYEIVSGAEGATVSTANTGGLWGELTVSAGTEALSITVKATSGEVSAEKTITFAAGTKTAEMNMASFGDVCYSDTLDMFVAGGANASIYSSADGITWAKRFEYGNSIGSNGQKGILWDGSKFVALYTGTVSAVLTSTDGITWNEYLVDKKLDTITKFGDVFLVSETGGKLYETSDFKTYAEISGQNSLMSSENGGYRGMLKISESEILLYNTYDWNGQYSENQKAELVLGTKTESGFVWEKISEGVFRRFYEMKVMSDNRILGVASTGSSSSVIIEYDRENKTVNYSTASSLGMYASTLCECGDDVLIGELNGGIYKIALSSLSINTKNGDLTKINAESVTDRLVTTGSNDRIFASAYNGNGTLVLAVRGKANGKIAVYDALKGTYKLKTVAAQAICPTLKITNGSYEISSNDDIKGAVYADYRAESAAALPQNATVYIAAYSGEKLEKINIATVVGKKNTAYITVSDGESFTYKAFVFDENLVPQISAVEK